MRRYYKDAVIMNEIPGYVSPELAAFSLSSFIALLGMYEKLSRTSSNMASAQRLLEFASLLSEGAYRSL